MDENKDSFKAAREQRKEKKNAEADRTTQALDNAANVAQFTPIGGYAKAYKTFRAIDDRVTGGKLSRTLSKTANATGPGVKSLSKVGSSGLANNAGKALAAKEKLSGKGGGPSASGGNTPAMKTTTTSSNVSGTPSTIGGSKNTAKSNKDSKKLNKEKKKQNSQSSISNQSSEKEEQTNLQSSSWAILMGEMTPMKIIILLIAAFVFIIVFLFIVLFSTIGNKLEFFKSQAFSEISSKVNNVSAGFSIGNINIIDNAMNFKDADYDFKQFNQDYESPGEGLVSASRDNSKRDTLLAWAKKFFPAEIYLNYFNIGNIFNTSDKKCYGDECNDRAEVLFYQKVADISFRYRKLYNIELDWPLIISTVLIKSTDKETTFANNLNDYTVLELNNLEEDMSLDWEYDYKDIQGYDYLSSDSRYDLQILAKNMVKKKTTQTCTSADGKITKKLELEDIEDSLIEKSKKEVTAPNYKPDPTKEDEVYYLVCESGAKYNVSSTYSLDKEKYKNFLEEYVEKRYFIAGTSNNASGNGGGIVPGYDPGASTSMGTADFGWPLPEGVNSISSHYGPRGKGYHYGVDFGIAVGTPVYAIADGVVEGAAAGCVAIPNDASCGGGYGNNVRINHGPDSNGNIVYAIYAHGSQVLVSKGQTVHRGQLIMYSGNTGHVLPVPTAEHPNYGQHLHFEIKLNNGTCTKCGVNPASYIGVS